MLAWLRGTKLALLVVVTLMASACTGSAERTSGSESSASEPANGASDVIGSDGVGETSPDAVAVEASSIDGPVLPVLDIGPNTLIWVHDQEPTSMHYDDPQHRLAVTSWVRRTLLEGLYGVSGATEFYPELLAEEGDVLENDDGSVTFELVLRQGLRWSNGDALTTEDVAYTWDIWRDGCELAEDGTIGDGTGCEYTAANRQGYDLISDLTVVSDTEFSITMVQFYGGWKRLFDEIFHPSFGDDAAVVNDSLSAWRSQDGTILVSAGPMIFDSWERGVSIDLVRNDLYHGSVSPDARNRGVTAVDGVVVRFVADTETQIRAIEAGEAHVIMTQPQVALGQRLSGNERFTVASAAGPIYEHWGFNLLNRHLADPSVREALAFALDKSEVMAELYEPLFGNVLPTAGLGNTYWMTNQRFYVDHQVSYSGAQVAEAEAKLIEAGYERGADGIHVHPDRGRLSLRVGTTGGNELRELQQQAISAQMERAGIEILIDNVDGNDYFTAQPFAAAALLAAVTDGAEGDSDLWDIAQFAWAGSPWPGGNSINYLAGRPTNPYGFANTEFDAQAAVCDATLESAERAACYNDLDLYLTTLEKDEGGLVVLPITQKPSYYGYLSAVLSGAGIASDADAAGPLANVVDFTFK